ncbi:MAG: hypothetical protein ACOYL5_19220, partial [Phototrophicaceae bacterium]
GNVSTIGSDADGIFAGGNVSNTGNVSTIGSDADGIFAYGNVTNTGNVSTSGSNAPGIATGVNVTHSGNVQVSGASAVGVNGTASNQTFNLSGSVIASGNATTAIDAKGGNDSVTLSGNARIQGIVNGGAGTDTLNLNQAVSECTATTLNASATTQTATAGGLTVNGAAFTWTNFEVLVAAMTNADSCNPSTSGGASASTGGANLFGNRLNNSDAAAPIALFCASPGNIAVYRVVGNKGAPLFAYSRVGNQVAFIGDSFGATVTVQGDGSVLIAMPQPDGKLYSTTIAANVCA